MRIYSLFAPVDPVPVCPWATPTDNCHPEDGAPVAAAIRAFRGWKRTVFLFGVLFSLFACAGSEPEGILTPEERHWLLRNRSRTVLAIETGYAPFVFLDAGGRPAGLAQDYLLLVESKIGVHFPQRTFSTLEEILDKARAGEIHIINAITKTPQRSTFLSFTDSYISVPNVFIVRKDYSGPVHEENLSGRKVSLVKSYAVTENLCNKGIGLVPDLVPDDLTALYNVSFGHSEAAVTDLATASYLIGWKGITNLRIAGETSFPIRLSIGTPIGEPVLQAILQKGLDAITESERKAIHHRWINAADANWYQDWRFRAAFGLLLFLVFAAVAGNLIWNKALRIQVAVRAEALAKERTHLQESEARFRSYFDLPLHGIAITSPAKGWIEVNDRICSLLGYAREELMRKTWVEMTHPDDLSADLRQFERVLAGEIDQYQLEKRFLHKSGKVIWIGLSVGCVRKADRLVDYFIALLEDITERKQIEDMQSFLAQTASATPDGLFFPALARYLAQSLEMDFVSIHRLQEDGRPARTLASWGNGPWEDNISSSRKDTPWGETAGRDVICYPADVRRLFPHDPLLQDLQAESFVGVIFFGHTGLPIGLMAAIGRRPLANRSVAVATLKMSALRASGELERLDAEEALREREARFRNIFEELPVAIWEEDFSDMKACFDELRRSGVSDFRTYLDTNPEKVSELAAKVRIRATNRKSVELLGAESEEQLIKEIPRYFTADSWPVFQEEILALAEGKTRFQTEIPILNTRGEPLNLILTLAVQPGYEETLSRVLVSFQNITEQRQAELERARLEAHLRQAQKMESVGRLAGGVAHDFNNMLGIILGHAELAIEQGDSTYRLHENLQEIRKAAVRSADLTRQLLAFARKQTIVPRVLDLNETVASLLKMLHRIIGENIQLTWNPGLRGWPVKMDPTQIDQLLVNLVTNARDAFTGVGQIVIATENCIFDREYCSTHPDYLPGEFVQLRVIDNGSGIDQETLPHIFEPFYTTKSTGKGTGLGLATVYGIVEQNNGFLAVESKPGQGTTIRIFLPRHVGPAEPHPIENPPEPLHRGRETILLVEDERGVLHLTMTMLEKQGYSVLATKSPSEAIRISEEYTGEICLLLTDVIMPEMNGCELAEKLQARYPGLKRLLMSGYTADIIAGQGVLEDGFHFIQKPFTLKALSAKVREVLDERGPA